MRTMTKMMWVAASLVSSASFADTSINVANQDRPTVAVVLAGGGAKGAAHIGVLQALEEMRIPVDIITGTSMGAYIGGLYATGMSAAEIESFIYSVDWSSGYRDRVDRSQRRVRDKEYEDRYQINPNIGFSLSEIQLPRGVVKGQGMLRILRETTGNLPPFESFDELAIPYRSVATDIIELEPVIISEGYLLDAMMASMSVPGALPPYTIGDKQLVDGGVTNNMPVDVARAMGADIVIAVDISTDYKSEDEFTTIFSVADQLSNYLVRRSTNQQASTLGEQDFFLRPEVGEMETTEFDKMPDAFKQGYSVVRSVEDKLSALTLSTADYQDYIDAKQAARKKLEYGDEILVDEIVIENNTHYSERLLRNRLALKPGQAYEAEEIEQSIQDLYALDHFELITYRYEREDDKDKLVVSVNEKSWGPNYANMRFFLEDDFATESQYSLGLSLNFTDIGLDGAEFRTNLEMGTDKLIETEFYTPLMSTQKLFTTVGFGYSNDKRYAPIGSDGFFSPSLEDTKNTLPVTYRQWEGEWAVGYQEKLWRQFRAGLRYTKGYAELSTLPACGDIDFTREGALSIIVTTLLMTSACRARVCTLMLSICFRETSLKPIPLALGPTEPVDG